VIYLGDNKIIYSDTLCFSLEKDYTIDEDIKQILENGETIDALIEASHTIKERESSGVLKFPIGVDCEIYDQISSIDELPNILEILCSTGSLGIVLECIDDSENKDICLKVSGSFSKLLSAVSSNVLFKWMRKYEAEILDALDKINDNLFWYIINAINMGVKIISYAEPSAMPDVLGEKNYKKFVADFTVKLMKKLEVYLCGSIMHLCPRTSAVLENYGYITSKCYFFDIQNYAKTLLAISQYNEIKFIGHRCINAEYAKNNNIYKLSLVNDNENS
jgi:hypothetical protein